MVSIGYLAPIERRFTANFIPFLHPTDLCKMFSINLIIRTRSGLINLNEWLKYRDFGINVNAVGRAGFANESEFLRRTKEFHITKYQCSTFHKVDDI